MGNDEKLDKLRKILSMQIEWYKVSLKEQGRDYVYDYLYNQFDDLSRSDYLDIIELLVS